MSHGPVTAGDGEGAAGLGDGEGDGDGAVGDAEGDAEADAEGDADGEEEGEAAGVPTIGGEGMGKVAPWVVLKHWAWHTLVQVPPFSRYVPYKRSSHLISHTKRYVYPNSRVAGE
jgi:hypothetical protein